MLKRILICFAKSRPNSIVNQPSSLTLIYLKINIKMQTWVRAWIMHGVVAEIQHEAGDIPWFLSNWIMQQYIAAPTPP